MAVETFFVVTINEDGSFSTSATLPENPIESKRPATNADVYNISKQVITEVENQMLTDRIVSTLVQVLSPRQETPADVVAAALQKREESAPEK